MLKFISVLIGVFVLGFLIVNDTWLVSVTAFGYQVTASALLFIVAIALFFYVIHLLKKPFRWLGGCGRWYADRKRSQKEAFLMQTLQAVLEQRQDVKKQLLKQRKNWFTPKSREFLLIEALFEPTPHVFEQLIQHPETELAGIRGLLSYAQKTGDLNEATRLLRKAAAKNPDEMWIMEELWRLQTLQNDWADALKTLDILKKNKHVTREEYDYRKGCLLLKLGRYQEASKLTPNNPTTALLQAKAEPAKALKILTKSWEKAPCWDNYLAFRDIIRTETPARQIKAVEKFVSSNPEHRLSLKAKAQTAMDAELWGVAKETLEAYMNAYSLTPKTAQMMAEVERKGWHHEEGAKEWEKKAEAAQEIGGWGCADCGHALSGWDAVCPLCNTFGSVQYR